MASIFLPKYLYASLTLLPLNRASPTHRRGSALGARALMCLIMGTNVWLGTVGRTRIVTPAVFCARIL
jgi:hypothetical protein